MIICANRPLQISHFFSFIILQRFVNTCTMVVLYRILDDLYKQKFIPYDHSSESEYANKIFNSE
jgi:hypothetical protein